MSRYNLFFESSPWLIAVGVLIGLLYTLILYYKNKGPWNKNLNLILATLRFLLVTQLTMLLFGPLVRMIKNTYEKPAIVFAIDNSISISEVIDSTHLIEFKHQLETLRKNLETTGYKTEILTLDDQGPLINISDVDFRAEKTDLFYLLDNIMNMYESRNLAKVIMVTDGLFNRGTNPVYKNYPFNIFTVGLGDTIQHPDINLNALLYNRIAYQGNKFPLVAEVFTSGLEGNELAINIYNKGNKIASKIVQINRGEQFDRVQFLLEANENGIKRYIVKAEPIESETIITNNTKEAYIDIIEGRLKILIATPAPHPDIKAIRKKKKKNQNYDVTLAIPGISQYKKDKYDAVILHGIPDKKNQFESLLKDIKKDNIPTWFIISKHSNLKQFSALNGLIRLQSLTNQKDLAFPIINKNFQIFNYPEDYSNKLEAYPPLIVPFTKYVLHPAARIMLNQKIGSIATTKPLLVLSSQDGQRKAVLIGEGIWQWRLQEYAHDKNFTAFDELISKITQFLSTKNDKRRFRTYPVKNEFITNEPVIFETEIYNEIYENIFGYKIDLLLKDESGKTTSYTYVTSKNNTNYRINGLNQGIYSYEAKGVINGDVMHTNGRFSVKNLQIESTRLRADFGLLRNLAYNTGGKFYVSNQINKMEREILSENPKSKIYSTEDYLAIINMKWGFFILILLVSIEWFLRKYYGSY